jgi:hypothetical protein
LKLLSFSPGETGVSPLDSVMTSSSELPQMRRILPASHYDEFRFSFQGPSVSSVGGEMLVSPVDGVKRDSRFVRSLVDAGWRLRTGAALLAARR